jgi:lysophospholipase L1-like esterase
VVLPPTPLIGRGKPTFASRDVERPGAVVDGRYCAPASWSTDTFPTWLAIKVGAGPDQLLLSWDNAHPADYLSDAAPPYAVPASYTIETSADSTDGANGAWRTVVDVRDNQVRARAHRFPFTGAAWVRMTVRGVIPGTVDHRLGIGEIDIHDASLGVADAVFFVGDSLTAAAYARCDRVQPSYQARVRAALPRHAPATISGGVGGVNSRYGADQIDRALAANPDFRFWAIGYGTNDAWQSVPPPLFERQVQTIVDRVLAAGHQPVLARIPYARKGPEDEQIRALNEVIDRLAARNGLPAGPDFYGWFRDHPRELGPDGVHPTDAGSISMNRLWHEALRPRYGRGVDPPRTPAAPDRSARACAPSPANCIRARPARARRRRGGGPAPHPRRAGRSARRNRPRCRRAGGVRRR